MNAIKTVWWVMRRGMKWDGPHFTEKSADAACLRARDDGYGLSVYVEAFRP